MAAQFKRRKDAVPGGEGRCLIRRGDADPFRRGRTLSKEDAVQVWQRKRCLGGRRTLTSPRVRTLSISEGKGCRSEGLLLDPALGRIDLSRYLQI